MLGHQFRWLEWSEEWLGPLVHGWKCWQTAKVVNPPTTMPFSPCPPMMNVIWRVSLLEKRSGHLKSGHTTFTMWIWRVPGRTAFVPLVCAKGSLLPLKYGKNREFWQYNVNREIRTYRVSGYTYGGGELSQTMAEGTVGVSPKLQIHQGTLLKWMWYTLAWWMSF